MHKKQGWPQAWEYGQAKPIQTLGRASQGVNWSWSQCIKSHHAQTSSGKELPSHFWNIVKSILPGLRRKKPGLLLSGPKSSFQIKVNFAVMSAGVGSLCFIKSKDNSAVYQEILEHFVLTSADKLYGDADFLFQQDLSTKSTSKWFADLDITGLDWPNNMPDLNPIWNLWDIFKRKMRNSGSNNTDELKAVPQAAALESSATGWSLSCHLTDAGVCAKRAPTKYWVHKWIYFKELELFCFANPFFFLIFGETDFWLMSCKL